MEEYINKKQRRELRKQEQEEKQQKIKQKKKIKRIVIYVFILAAIVFVVLSLINALFNKKILPPFISHGHIEESPSSHILTVPMRDVIQRHMLEHADGSGPPGIIIQYNCDKYTCENDLVQRLVDIVEEYKEFVYLAPNSEYDGKIILTKEGNFDILNEFDEGRIRKFIGS